MNLQEIIERLKAVSDTPVLDARLLVAYADPKELDQWVDRRLKHEPVSKIIGRRGFWKSDFITTKDVLDPRPDTEMMIEAVLESYTDRAVEKHILDIGIGSGCILYSLLDEYPKADGVGIDKSKAALAIAERNRNGRKAHLFNKDFMKPDWTNDLGMFDIVVSNPPYIPTSDIQNLEPDVCQFDPMMALDGGKDGLNAYRALAKSIPTIIKTDGMVFLEVGIGQAKDVIALFENNGMMKQKLHRDYGGVERIVSFKKA